MKKLFLAAAVAVLGITAANAQTDGGFRLGAHVGLPMGDAADVFSLNLGVDAGYMWNVAPNFELGIATGYSHYMVKSDYSDIVDGAGLIPIAASGQYNIDGGFNIGADLGYGLFTNEGAEGGFYYQPKIGYNVGAGNVYLGYKGVSNDGSINSLNLGYIHRF